MSEKKKLDKKHPNEIMIVSELSSVKLKIKLLSTQKNEELIFDSKKIYKKQYKFTYNFSLSLYIKEETKKKS